MLYPEASQFRELPASDATLLVAFYDSLQGVTDTLDSYIDRWSTTDVNAWNGIMHQVQNSLALGEKAIKVFCAEKPFNEAARLPIRCSISISPWSQERKGLSTRI